MRRKRFDHKPAKSTFALNITSLTDMFTIMLVFLLQTYSTSEVQLEPSKGMQIPMSNTNLNPVDGVRMILSKESLKVGDREIAGVKDRHFASVDMDGKDPNFLPALFAELERLNKDAGDDPKKKAIKEGRVLLMADAALPYETLRKVLYTSSMAGFVQLKMVTMAGN